MLPKWHFLFGYIFSLLLIYFFKFSLLAGLVVFLSSVFIDLDHVLLYFLKTKNLNPFKFYSWAIRQRSDWLGLEYKVRDKYTSPHFILHGIEFLALIIFLSFIHVFFSWILTGVLFHLILDFIEIFYKREHISIKTSQIWLWQRNKNRKEFVVE